MAERLVISRPEAAPYRVDVVRAPSSLGPAAVVVFVKEAHRAAAGVRGLLQQAYGLTAGEERAVLAIADDMTVADVAERFGVRVGTVRNQLKRSLQKVGVHRQSALVRLVGSLASPLADAATPRGKSPNGQPSL